MLSLEREIRRLIVQSQAEAVAAALQSQSKGLSLFIDADRPFHPASTIKICVMMEAYRAHHAGRFSLDSEVLVSNRFASIVDGSQYELSKCDDSDPELYDLVGCSAPARELVERMIVRSSNLATNLLIQILLPEKVNAFMQHLEADGLVVKRGVEDNKAYKAGLNNVATARSLNTILLRLLAGTVVSSEADRQMIEILLKQELNDGIPKLLPAEARVAHKTGWNGPLYHDVGIVYPILNEPYVLTVMTQGLDGETNGPELVAEVSKMIYEALTD